MAGKRKGVPSKVPDTTKEAPPVTQLLSDVLEALPAETSEDRRWASRLRLVLRALHISSH